MQLLQPEIDQIKEQYKDNEDLVQMRTTLLFEQTEVAPTAARPSRTAPPVPSATCV